MRQEPDIVLETSRQDDEADRASRELGAQVDKARRVLREYRLALRRRRLSQGAP